jgi:hypothetical protein
MAIEVPPPGEFPEIVIFQKLVHAHEHRQGISRRSLQKPPPDEIEMEKGEKGPDE